MRTLLLTPLLLLGAIASQTGAALQFAEPIAVTAEAQPGVFHHLDSAGRKNIALSGDRIAVTWEDNSDGRPRVYFASKHLQAQAFGAALRISGPGEAYEPAIAGLGDGRFVVLWEEDGRTFARSVDNDQPAPGLQLSRQAAGHASVAGWRGQAHAVWRERRNGHPAIHYGLLTADPAGALSASGAIPIEPEGAGAPQLYPTIAVSSAGVAVAWEDRRAGHTRLLYSHSKDGRRFAPPTELNEFLSNRNAYDKGNGVTRVALARLGEDEVLAAWMDKRRSKKGYGIYAAFGSEGGEYFGPNERVQDSRGDELPHYNPAVAGNDAGAFVVAWDDYRSGTSDIWLSRYDDDLEWRMDVSPPAASGAGEQSNPSVAMDADNRIHLVWIERSAFGKPTRIWYAMSDSDTLQ